MQSAEWYRARSYTTLLTDADKAIIRNDWAELKKQDFYSSFSNRCPNCYHDAIILILRKMDKPDNGGYELKSGIAFRYKGKVYTKNNITAQAAEWYIKQDLNHRDDFISLGKDYDGYTTTSAIVVKDGK